MTLYTVANGKNAAIFTQQELTTFISVNGLRFASVIHPWFVAFFINSLGSCSVYSSYTLARYFKEMWKL